MSLEELVVTMNTLGIRYDVLETGAEGAVLVLPDYGRVLGVWPHWRGENALWVNPEFIRFLQIGAKDDGWLNPGGDRMWLGPQAEFFPRDTVPPSVDPGRYDSVPDKGWTTMANKGEVRAWESGMMMGFRIQRRIRPLSEEEISAAWGTRWLRQAGYAEETSLEVFGEIPPAVWLWNITQLNPDAEILRETGAGPAASRTGSPGEKSSRILCLEERADGRGLLVVKSFQDASAAGRPWARHAASSSGPREISCVSTPAGSAAHRKVQWRTGLCAFSGRAAEIRAAARMMGSGAA